MLLGLNFNSHTFCQFCKLSNILKVLSVSLASIITLRSSANSFDIPLIQSGKSLIKMTNNKGPKTSLYKKGSRKDALNYRPVSLTCILCKVYEKLIRRHIMSFVSKKINPNQHGFVEGKFVEGKSCLSNLLESVECNY